MFLNQVFTLPEKEPVHGIRILNMKTGSGFWQGLLIVDGNFCSGDIKKDKEESVMDKEVRDWSSFALEPEDLI